MNLHAVPSDICLAMDIHSPKWRDHDLLSGEDMALDIVQTKLHVHNGARAC